MFYFEVKYLDSPFLINKSKQFNVELIDVSVRLPIDVRQGLAVQYHYKDNPDLTTNKIKSPNGMSETRMPSPAYMFTDIATILFYDALFVWEEKKYDKRIKRLFYIILTCLVNEKSVREVHDIYLSIKQFFVLVNNLKTINDKLNPLRIHFEISSSPLKDKLNKLLGKSIKQEIIIDHLEIKLKNDSPLKKLKFFEFLIEKYIEMLIIGEYILSNQSNYPEFCRDKLMFFFLIDSVDNYFDSGTIVLTKGLENIYKEINGASIKLTA